MTAFPLSSKLLASFEGENAAGRQWIADLPSTVAELAERWGLELGEPFQPGGQCSWAAPVVRDGVELVLKVGWPHEEARDEALGLQAWNGAGAVRLLAHDEAANAMLLERLRPGTSGWDLPAAEQDELVASMLRRLWIPAPAGFRALGEMCEQWTSREPRNALEGDGFALFRELARTAPAEVLLHTDLHAGNILAAEREPWLVIDPKPYVGDPAYDLTQHFMSCTHFEADPAALVRRMADLVELDEERVRRWAFARCIVESAGQPQLLAAARQLGP